MYTDTDESYVSQVTTCMYYTDEYVFILFYSMCRVTVLSRTQLSNIVLVECCVKTIPTWKFLKRLFKNYFYVHIYVNKNIKIRTIL